jgi:hypothetical protein
VQTLRTFPAFRAARFAAVLLSVPLIAGLTSCGGGGTVATSSTTTAATTNAYATAYQAVSWGSRVTVSFTSNCTMTVAATGVPPVHDTYYLAPAANGQTVVATTASGIQLAVMPYTGGISNVNKISASFNICPAKAASTTATGGGAIGLITSGESLFDPYEATGTVALSDNASYTFTSGGQSYTASFIDQCNSHAAGNMSGTSTWHYHGNPVCYTATVDKAGPSHIVGIALDGFPIYGGRDVNGNVVAASSLDACNGITSPTPEFPNGAYHYVLPVDSSGNALTTKQSAMTCYAGTVSSQLSAAMKQLRCTMPFLLANGRARLPDGREVSRAEGQAYVEQMKRQMGGSMPGMQLAGNRPPAGLRSPATRGL